STTLELEPLQPGESAELVEALTAELELPVDIATVLAKTEGNPLFVEETIRMLAERPRDGAERIPDTLQALIAARIDRLPGAERVLLQRAAAMGRIFMAGALAQLSPELDDVSDPLDGLLLRDLIVREPRASISGEQAYKFRHVLIREVAYSGLSKMSRAELHRAFAGWLKERAGDELVEIRAFHLDQAARLLAELDGSAPPDLNEEAASALTHAGRRALSREAFRSARKLLLRAAELAPTLERRYFAGRAAWRLGDMTAVIVEMEDVAAVAAAHGERCLQGRALTALAEAVLNQRADAVAARELAEQAIEVLADEPPDIRFEAFRAATADDVEAADTSARTLFHEVGNTAAEAGATMQIGRLAMVRGDLTRAEKLLAEAVRTMKGLNDRAKLCEAQRSLGEVYVHLGRLEEAERLALEARESVGPEDRVSLSTTKASLAAVR